MHIGKSEEKRIVTEVPDVLPIDVEIALLRRGYKKLTGSGEVHTEVRYWFESHVPQVSDSEILEVYSRMLLIERAPCPAAMGREREVLVLRLLFFRACHLAREKKDPLTHESIWGEECKGYSEAQLREIPLRVFRACVSVMPEGFTG